MRFVNIIGGIGKMRKKTGLILTAGFLMAAMITGCGGKNTDVPDTQEAQQTESDTEAEAEAPAAIEVDMANYESIIASLPEGYYYAFADIDKDNDALLVAEPDAVFEDLEGNKNAKAARIYGYDNNGNIKEYGYIESGSTANPLAVKEGKVYYASHDTLSTAYIDEASSELVTSESDSFEDYDDVVVIVFNAAGESEETGAAGTEATGTEAAGTYKYEPAEGEDTQDVPAEASIELNADFTGKLTLQDTVDITWEGNEIKAADGSFAYQFAIEGDSLNLNYDGTWLTFTK